MTTTIRDSDETDADAAERADSLHRDARPELRGYVDVTRHADGSPREITLTVGYGSYGNRGPSRNDVALSYCVDDEGIARVRSVVLGRKDFTCDPGYGLAAGRSKTCHVRFGVMGLVIRQRVKLV